MSIPSEKNTILRWTHNEGHSPEQYETFIRKSVYRYFLNALEEAHKNVEQNLENKIEADFAAREHQSEQQSKNQRALERLFFEKRVIQEYLYADATLSDLRGAMGAVQHEITSILNDKNETWETTWSMAIESTIPEDVRFSFNVLQEAIERTYGKELSEFESMWKEFARKRNKKSDNPLDVVKFIQTVYNTQILKGIQGELQNLIFLELEQEIIQGLGIILFEMQGRLSQMGIEPQANDKIDNLILKRKNVYSSGDTEAQSVNDEALFNTLVDLFKNWEPKGSDTDIEEEPKPLTSQELFSAITTLQQWAPKVLEEALGHPDGRLSKHLKESLIQQAETLGIPAGKAHMSAGDEEAVELVDEVFTKNLYERKMQDAARHILAQMLFPSVKAAILNRRWFAEEAHPARKFISSITDACAPENGEADLRSMERARNAVDKLVSGFNEDVSIFEVLTKEIQQAFAQTNQGEDVLEEDEDTFRRKKIIFELRQKWMWWSGPKPVMDFALQLGCEYLAELDKNQERGGMRWGMAFEALEQLLRLRSTKNDKVRIDGILRDHLMKMLMANGWAGVRAHNRLAEQEDIIHAYYAYGRTDFSSYEQSDDILSQSVSFKPNDEDLNEAPKVVLENVVELPVIESSVATVAVSEETVNDNSYDQKHTNQETHIVSLEIDSMINDHAEKDGMATEMEMEKSIEGLLFESVETEELQNLFSTENPNNLQDNPEASTTSDQAEQTDSDQTIIAEDVKETLIIAMSKESGELYEVIRNMQIGSISTLVDVNDEAVKVRLSWISPISMKYLFVNKNGARILTGTPKDLLSMAEKGRFFPNQTPDDISGL